MKCAPTWEMGVHTNHSKIWTVHVRKSRKLLSQLVTFKTCWENDYLTMPRYQDVLKPTWKLRKVRKVLRCRDNRMQTNGRSLTRACFSLVVWAWVSEWGWHYIILQDCGVTTSKLNPFYKLPRHPDGNPTNVFSAY